MPLVTAKGRGRYQSSQCEVRLLLFSCFVKKRLNVCIEMIETHLRAVPLANIFPKSNLLN